MFSLFSRKRPASTVKPEPPDPADRVIDVESMIRQASVKVSVDKLLRKGKRHIHLLSGERIEELINRSVRTIVDKYRAEDLSDVPAERIAEEARAEFQELLQHYQTMARAKRDVEQSKKLLDGDLEKLHAELERERVEAQRKKTDPTDEEYLEQFDEFVGDVTGQIDQLFASRRRILQGSKSSQALEDLERVEKAMGAIWAKLIAGERTKFLAGSRDARENAILKKRLEKLGEYVASLEGALKQLSNSKLQSNQQVQNLLRKLGLAQEDRYYEKKKEALKLVLEANQSVRKVARSLHEKGITLATPGGLAAAAAAASAAAAAPPPSPLPPLVDAAPEPAAPIPAPAPAPIPVAEESPKVALSAGANAGWSMDSSP